MKGKLSHDISTIFEQTLRNSKFQQDLVLFRLTKITKMDSKVFNSNTKERKSLSTKCLHKVTSCFLKSKKNVQHILDWFFFTVKMQVFWNTEAILKIDLFFMFFITPTEVLLSKIHEELQIWIWFRHYNRIPKKYVPNTLLTNISLIKQVGLLDKSIFIKH